MTTYPTGVLQNYAAPGNPPQLLPVGEQNWKMFATRADAERGLEMIRTVSLDAQMKDAHEGQYNQFVYEDENPDIRVRIAYGTVDELSIEEFPSHILDRSITPQPFIDQTPPKVLRCRPATPEIGELYWASA